MVSKIDQDNANRNNYDDLLVSIEANYDQLNLLIAVCDNPKFRDEIIGQYEQELDPEIARHRIRLSPEKPSLSLLINKLIQENPELKNAKNAVITVTGAEQFRFLFKSESKQKSPQEELLGYFQWTREALRNFPYSIVLWVTSYLQQQLDQKSPDFWSWRKGVFRFTYPATSVVDVTNLKPQLSAFSSELNEESSSLLPLEDLQELIAKIEQNQGKKTAQLADLYSDLGRVYRERSEQGKSVNYKEEQNLGIQYLQKAIQLQQELNLDLELAYSLDNLAGIYKSQGKYEQAESLYLQALILRRKLLGEEHLHVANSLNNLAGLYYSQGRYEEAESLYLQALELARKLLGEEHLHVATCLNNLAGLYSSQGRYEEAETLLISALKLSRKLLGEKHPDVATSLNNLAEVYRLEGRYEEADPLYLQALELFRKLLGGEHPNVATSINNLAELYYSQGRYEEAESLSFQALELKRKLLGEEHPDVSASLNNLAGLYHSQGRYEEAEPLYLQALELSRKVLGEKHPNTKTFLNNFEYFLQQVIQENRVSELSNHPLTQSLLEKLQSLS